MTKCSDYAKYFHDYVDDVLSRRNRKAYEDHTDTCALCTEMLRQDRRYRKGLEALTQSEDLPSGLDLRFKGRFNFWQRELPMEMFGDAEAVVLMGKTCLPDARATYLLSSRRCELQSQEEG